MNTYPTHQQTLELKYNKINAISTITQFFPVPMSPLFPSLMSLIWFVKERKWFNGSSLKQHHMKSGFPWLEAPLEDDSHILLKYHFSVACWWRVFWNCGNNRSDEPGSGHGAARGLSELGPRVTGNWRREHEEESCNPTRSLPSLFKPFFSWREPEKLLQCFTLSPACAMEELEMDEFASKSLGKDSFRRLLGLYNKEIILRLESEEGMWWSKEGGCMQKRESLDIPGTSGDHTDCTIGAENGCVLGSIVIQLLVQCVQCVLPGLPLPLCAGSPHPPPVPMWMQVLQLRNTFLEILNILFKK